MDEKKKSRYRDGNHPSGVFSSSVDPSSYDVWIFVSGALKMNDYVRTYNEMHFAIAEKNMGIYETDCFCFLMHSFFDVVFSDCRIYAVVSYFYQ